MGYRQLNEQDRMTIWSLCRDGVSQADIARRLGCHRSTISRELQRNNTMNGYDARKAQKLATERKRHNNEKVIPDLNSLLGMLNTLGWPRDKQKEFILRHHPDLKPAVEQTLG